MPVNPWLAVTAGTAGPGYAARFAALAHDGGGGCAVSVPTRSRTR